MRSSLPMLHRVLILALLPASLLSSDTSCASMCKSIEAESLSPAKSCNLWQRRGSIKSYKLSKAGKNVGEVSDRVRFHSVPKFYIVSLSFSFVIAFC